MRKGSFKAAYIVLLLQQQVFFPAGLKRDHSVVPLEVTSPPLRSGDRGAILFLALRWACGGGNVPGDSQMFVLCTCCCILYTEGSR